MPRSWDDPQFTCEYSQPPSYRFSLDSILLAKAVVRDWRQPIDQPKTLDLCAGCGVIGLEISHLNSSFRDFDFVEIQNAAYHPHFVKNLACSPHLERTRARWLPMNYSELTHLYWSNRYDLVVCNPPYFETRQGLLPPDELKARSRFFIDSDFTTLWRAVLNVLKPGGEAYVLVRERDDHGEYRKGIISDILSDNAKILAVEDLRGTWLYRIQKKSISQPEAE